MIPKCVHEALKEMRCPGCGLHIPFEVDTRQREDRAFRIRLHARHNLQRFAYDLRIPEYYWRSAIVDHDVMLFRQIVFAAEKMCREISDRTCPPVTLLLDEDRSPIPAPVQRREVAKTNTPTEPLRNILL